MKILRWSLPICRVSGIRIQVHFTFGLLLAWIALMGYHEAQWAGAGWAMVLLASIFTCVALHELGHSLVAQRLGVGVRDITLLPIGGVASLRDLPEHPHQELAITIAGPLVNVAIFLALFLGGYFAPWDIPIPLPYLDRMPRGLLEIWGALIYINAMMVLFNLIPAFPMDGGRILRALLVPWLGYVRSTHAAVAVAKVIAVLFLLAGFTPALLFLYGLAPPVWLGIIGVVIFFLARSEQQTVWLRFVLRSAAAEDIMNRDFLAVSPGDGLNKCLQQAIRSGQEDFPVLYDGELVGLLQRDALARALRKEGDNSVVGEAMVTQFPSLSPRASLDEVYARMLDGNWLGLPVRDDGQLVGWLSREHVNRYLDSRLHR